MEGKFGPQRVARYSDGQVSHKTLKMWNMGHRHCNTEKLKFRVWILHVKAVLVIYVLNFYFYATPCKWRRQIVFVFCLFVSPAHIVFSSGSLSYKAFMTTSANENVTDFFPLMQILWLMKKKPKYTICYYVLKIKPVQKFINCFYVWIEMYH